MRGDRSGGGPALPGLRLTACLFQKISLSEAVILEGPGLRSFEFFSSAWIRFIYLVLGISEVRDLCAI